MLQYVEYNNLKIYDISLRREAPQGNTQAPLIFSDFINALATNISIDCLSFVDNLKLFRTVPSPADCLVFEDDNNIFSN